MSTYKIVKAYEFQYIYRVYKKRWYGWELQESICALSMEDAERMVRNKEHPLERTLTL